MTELTLYQADAFTSELFKGNPAAVVPLAGEFLPDALMQAIAFENNLSETAFVLPRKDAGHYDLRWFTPEVEIEFCGHATIATAHILFTELKVKLPVTFHTQIGMLSVSRSASGYTLTGPNYPRAPLKITPQMRSAFPMTLLEAFSSRDNLYFVTDKAATVREFQPDFPKIAALGPHGIGLTAAGDGAADFSSRLFFPAIDLPEDPVTGSAHSALAPYWAEKLAKSDMLAHQVSRRGGVLKIEVTKTAVKLTGEAVTYLRGTITLPD